MTDGRLTSSLLVQAWPRIWLEETDSTNSEAGRRIRTGDVGPVWIAARKQTEGRGRRGRRWLSEPGNLFATALFPLDAEPSLAALTCFTTCIALREAFSDIGCDISEVVYKWPNDLLWRNRKLSGILIETIQYASDMLALSVGVGVNILTAPETDQETARLMDLIEHDESVTPDILLERLAEHFSAEMDRLLRFGFESTRKTWIEHARGLNEPISVQVGNDKISGIFRDLDHDGALILQTESGYRRITAGDVQLLQS